MPEEDVAVVRDLLRARLQHLDGSRDRRERGLELVGGVRDELALCLLAPLLLRDVGDDEHRGVAAVPRRDADERIGSQLVGCDPGLRDLRLRPEEVRGHLPERDFLPWLGERFSLERAFEVEGSVSSGVCKLDLEVWVHGNDAFMQALEHLIEPVALKLELRERLAQLLPHPVDRQRQRAELVPEPEPGL